MSSRLMGVDAKLGRARAHIGALDLAMDHFMGERQPYKAVAENDRASGELIYKIEIHEQPPTQWALLLADALQNVRAALDYLACELTLLNLGSSADLSHCGYPVFTDPARFEAILPQRIGGVTPAQRTLLEQTQPYTRPNPDQFDPIEVAWALADINQQRALTVPWIGLRNIDFPRDRIALTKGPNLGPLENGAELARFRLLTPHPQMQVHAQFAYGITLTDPITQAPLAVRTLLGAVHDRVANIADAFRPMFDGHGQS